MPFCKPTGKQLRHKSHSLGVILEGTELVDSGLQVQFMQDLPLSQICEMEITSDIAATLSKAVKEHYWYQMYVDELPIWGMVGEYMTSDGDAPAPVNGLDTLGQTKTAASLNSQEKAFLYTHKTFSVSYNGNQIIEVNLTSEHPRPIVAGETYQMTFSVQWHATEKQFDDRFDRYLDFDFFEHQIHWFSIFNSFMMVVFLCGLVVLILMRTLKSDYARYSLDDDDLELDSVVEEVGWKQVHGEVFQQPRFFTIFSASVGLGAQLFVLAFSVILVVILGSMYDSRGSLETTCVVMYSLTSFVAGLASSHHYKRSGGKAYKRVMLLTATLFPVLCASISFVLNGIAVLYNSMAAMSFGTMLLILAIWLFVSFPLVVAGTIVGRRFTKENDHPCRVIGTRPIPNNPFLAKPWTLALLAGLLPYGSIFIEMYFIFTSFWNYKFYYVYGFMFLVYCILVIVSICVSIVTTYFLLNHEDYRWHWTAFFSSGSTAIYVFLYSVYYFVVKTHMSGVLQTCFYFGYMAIFCLALFFLCGTIGYLGSSMFVYRIYQNIKSD